MKKYLLLTLLVLSTFLLVGCGKAKASESKETVKIAYLPITHTLAALEEARNLKLAQMETFGWSLLNMVLGQSF